MFSFIILIFHDIFIILPKKNNKNHFFPQETRRIVGAQIQHITYSEFLPVILGKEAMDRFNLDPQKMGFFSDYDINTNPGTANSVSTAAFRFVASLLPGVIKYFDSKGNIIVISIIRIKFYFKE